MQKKWGRRSRSSRVGSSNCANYIIYSTLKKITQLWLVDSSTINPKYSTLQEYLLSFHWNSAWEQPNVANLNVLIGETRRKGIWTEVTILWNDLLDQFIKVRNNLQVARLHTIRSFAERTINKKSHDLLVQFVINRYEWFWKFSKLHELLGIINVNNKIYRQPTTDKAIC